MAKREYTTDHDSGNGCFMELVDTLNIQKNKKPKLICSHSSATRMIMIDFPNAFSLHHHEQNIVENDEFVRKLEHLLKKKFSLQQLGKKKWLLNRELKYSNFFPIEFMNDKEFVLNHVKKYGYGFNFATKQLKQDKDFVLKIVQHNGLELEFASEDIRNDPEVVLAAVTQQARALRYASHILRNDKELILEAARQNGDILWFRSGIDRDILLAAVKQNGVLLQFVQLTDFKYDREIIFEAIKQNKKALRWAPKDLIQDHNFMLKVLKLIIPEFTTVHCFDFSKEEIMAKLVQDCGFLLEFSTDTLKSNRDIVLTAVRNDGRSLQFASDELKSDKSIVLNAVRNDAMSLRFASDDLKNDKEIAFAAVSKNGNALQWVSEELKGDKELVLAAITSGKYAFAIEFASTTLQKDREVVLAAIKQNGCALMYADESTKNNQEIVLEAIKQRQSDSYFTILHKHVGIWKYVSKNLLIDKTFLLEVIKLGCTKIVEDIEFISASLQLNTLGYRDICCDKDIMMKAVKSNGCALRHASEELQRDSGLVMEALQCNGFAFEYSDELYQTRMEYCYHGAYLHVTK